MYTADPSWCAIKYTYTVKDSDGNVVNSVTSDLLLSFEDLNRVFTIYNKSNIDLSGPASKTYKIEVTGTAGNVTPTSGKASFDLTVKNPCISPDFVTIQAEALIDQSYELYEYDPDGFEFTHNEFRIQTVPISHELCGGLTYTSTFNGLAINSSSAWPVKYNGSSLQHSVYSEDTSLLNMTNGTTVL